MLSLVKAIAANQTPGGVLMFRFHRVAARIAARFGTETANSWIRAVTRFQGTIDEKLLRSALVAKDLAGIDAAIKSSGFGRIMRDLEKPLLRTAGAAGTASAQTLTKAGFKFQFNAVHPNVVLFARDQTAALVVKVTQDVRVAIRTVVALGAQQGLTIQQQARAIRSVVGLPPPWSGSPLRMGAEIRSGNAAAATARRLSAVDKQQIRSRIAKGTVTEPFISSMQERYAKSLINRRALNISRTETLRAANFGQNESWLQASNQGVLPADSRRFWIVTPDDRLSEEHAQIPAMNPEGRGLEELFETPDGPFMYPPSRPNCRCGIGLGVGTGGPPGQAPADASVGPPLLGRDLSTDLPTYISLSSKESTAVAKQAGVKLTTRGTSATLRQRQTSAILAQGAKDVNALGFDLSKLNLRMKGSSKITDSVFNPKPTGKGVEITLRNRSGAEWAELQSRNKLGNPPWSASDDLAGAVHHEIGNALHHNAVGGVEWERLASWEAKGFPAKGLPVVKQVSQFAARSPRAFVGDVFSGLTSGKQYPANVLKLYQDLKGPVAPSWRKMFNDILAGKKVKIPKPISAVAPPPTPPGAVPLKVSQGPIQSFISNPVRTPKEIQEAFKRLGIRTPRTSRVLTLEERQTVEMLLQGAKDVEALGFDLSGLRMVAKKSLGKGVTGTYTPSARVVQLRIQPLKRLERFLKENFKEKWHPTNSWMSTVHHELGHAIHHKEARAFYNQLTNWNTLSKQDLASRPLMAAGRGRDLAREVSRYAQTNPKELVAEMFNGLVSGAKYSDDVMRLYMELRGPIAKQWRSRFEAVVQRAKPKPVRKRAPRKKKEVKVDVDIESALAKRYEKHFTIAERKKLQSGTGTPTGLFKRTRIDADLGLLRKAENFREFEMRNALRDAGIGESKILQKLAQYDKLIKGYGINADSRAAGIVKYLSELHTGGKTVYHGRRFLDDVKELRNAFLRDAKKDLLNLLGAAGLSEEEALLLMAWDQRISTVVLGNAGRVKTIKLYRGISGDYFVNSKTAIPKPGAKGTLQVNSASSWTSELNVAENFASNQVETFGGGLVLEADVPVDFIFANYRTTRQFLHTDEAEFILFGRKIKYKVRRFSVEEF